MADYIDREAFKGKYLCCGYFPEMSEAEFDSFPPCDVQPVRHGEWTVIEYDWDEKTIYQCSVCKEEFVTIDETPLEHLYNYCPNCGAKMDGGDDQ